MTFVLSLLHKIVGIDAEAIVIAAGDVPYVVVPTGRPEVGTTAVPAHVIDRIVKELLPVEVQVAFDDLGAVEYELPSPLELAGERFTVVADCHRGLRIEIRRHRTEETLTLPAADSLWPPDLA